MRLQQDRGEETAGGQLDFTSCLAADLDGTMVVEVFCDRCY